MKKLFCVLCIALVFTACSSNSSVNSLRPATNNSEQADIAYLINNLDDLKENSTDIIKGTVTELSSKVVRTKVHVYTSVEITEVSKGDLESGDEITILRSRASDDGGKIVNHNGERGDYAECNVGTEYIFFLRGPDKTYKERGTVEEVYSPTHSKYAFPVPGKTRSAQSEVELLLENSNFSTESKEKYYDLYAEVKEEYMK